MLWVMRSIVCLCLSLTGVYGVLCPRGYTEQHLNSCYLFSNDLETWTGAVISCQILGGHLVEIETADELQFLQTQSRRHQASNRWVALSEKRIPNEWEWATSGAVYNATTSGLQLWGPGEPDHYNGRGDEDCAALDQPHDFLLADVHCNMRYLYICEHTEEQFVVGK